MQRQMNFFSWPCEHSASWSTLMPTFPLPPTDKLIPQLDLHKDTVYVGFSDARQTRWWQNDAQMAATNRTPYVFPFQTHKFHRKSGSPFTAFKTHYARVLPDRRKEKGKSRRITRQTSFGRKNLSYLFNFAVEYENWKMKWGNAGYECENVLRS